VPVAASVPESGRSSRDRFQERRHFELVGREGQLEPPITSQPDAAVQMRARLCPHQVGASNGER
jgi:hypothetical protein